MTKPQFVVLIHGLHQSHLIMNTLAQRLKKQGFTPFCFDYHSVNEGIEQHSNRLNQWLIETIPEGECFHIIAHSLGGLVVRDFLYRFPQWHAQKQIANSVTLGTPHNGSITAQYAKKYLPFMIGHAYTNALDGHAPALIEGVCLGVIAGNQPRGLGTPFLTIHNKQAKFNKEQRINDGTVYLHETKLSNAKEHIIMPVTHTGMLINKAVAEQTIHFLRHARFKE